MILDYGLISCAAAMFSLQFLFSRQYEKSSGDSVNAVLKFTIGTNIAGIIILFFISGFSFAVTPFSLAVAAASAINSMLYSFCSIRSLGKINLSLYSVFAMLGGMALPFAAGIIFFDEKLTAGKIICFILIIISLLFTIEKGNRKSGYIYYLGIFVFNGLSGVIAKFYSASAHNKVSSAEYSILASLCLLVLCTVLLLITGKGKEKAKIEKKSLLSIGGYGIMSHVGNYFLLISLRKLPASAQYPFITGGVMILSTIICFFTSEKPGKKDIISVAFAFAGIIVLMILG